MYPFNCTHSKCSVGTDCGHLGNWYPVMTCESDNLQIDIESLDMSYCRAIFLKTIASVYQTKLDCPHTLQVTLFHVCSENYTIMCIVYRLDGLLKKMKFVISDFFVAVMG